MNAWNVLPLKREKEGGFYVVFKCLCAYQNEGECKFRNLSGFRKRYIRSLPPDSSDLVKCFPWKQWVTSIISRDVFWQTSLAEVNKSLHNNGAIDGWSCETSRSQFKIPQKTQKIDLCHFQKRPKGLVGFLGLLSYCFSKFSDAFMGLFSRAFFKKSWRRW